MVVAKARLKVFNLIVRSVHTSSLLQFPVTSPFLPKAVSPIVFQHSFYVSAIITLPGGPRNFHFIRHKDGDLIKVSSVNAPGKAAGGFGMLAAMRW